MHAELSSKDTEILRSTLSLFSRAGVELAPDIEPDDVEDAIDDDLISFRTNPVTTLAGCTTPDGEPLLAGTVITSGAAAGSAGDPDFTATIEHLATAAGTSAFDIAVMPDPGSEGQTGSLRVRFGDWDVADINYDLSDPQRTFELDLISAALPVDATAATFPTPDGRYVTLFFPSDADPASVDALLLAIEAEFEA